MIRLLAKIAAAGVLTLLFGEMLVRLVLPQQPVPDWLQRDARYKTSLRKHSTGAYPFYGSDAVMTVRINALGLRDREFSAAELADTTQLRILLLGDSFTFGHGLNVEEIFAHKIDQILSVNGIDALVFNAGVSGWGLRQSLQHARDRLDLFRPDVIILTFCGNDPADDRDYQRFLREGDGMMLFLKQSIYKYSHLYRLVTFRLHLLFHRRRLEAAMKKTGGAQRLDEQSASIISDDGWRQTAAQISNFLGEYQQRFPHGSLYVQATAPWEADIRDHLLAIADTTEITYIDLLPAAELLSPAERSLPYDGHWSVAMHDIAAQAISEALLRRQSRQR